MPQVCYTVDFLGGSWKIGLNGKHFGPYSTIETATAAASKAAHQAEAQGYEAVLIINSAEPAKEEPQQEASARDAA